MHAGITKHFGAIHLLAAVLLKNSTKKVAHAHKPRAKAPFSCCHSLHLPTVLLANEREAMATISAATATTIVARAAVARPSQALGLRRLRVGADKVRCGYSKNAKKAAAPAVVDGASLLAAASAMTVSAAPALALVDERMSTEGTGLSLGLSNNLLGWILLGMFGLIWSLYSVYTSTLDDDEESGGLSL